MFSTRKMARRWVCAHLLRRSEGAIDNCQQAPKPLQLTSFTLRVTAHFGANIRIEIYILYGCIAHFRSHLRI